MTAPWKAVVALLLQFVTISTCIPSPVVTPQPKQLQPQIWTVLDFLNAQDDRAYNYNFAHLINAQKKTQEISALELEVEVECIDKDRCNENTLICKAFVEYFPETDTFQTLPDVECNPNEGSSIKEVQHAVTEEIPSPRKSQQHCTGCLFELNKDAEGSQDLIDAALDHINFDRQIRHSLINVLKLERQIVGGVKYYLLLEVAPTVCSINISKLELCPVDEGAKNEICQIQYYQRPWISKDKHIVSNNCTATQEYIRSPKSNELDNEIETNNDIKKVEVEEITDKGPNFEKMAESGKLFDELISQIIPTEPDVQKSTNVEHVEATKSVIDNSQMGIEDRAVTPTHVTYNRLVDFLTQFLYNLNLYENSVPIGTIYAEDGRLRIKRELNTADPLKKAKHDSSSEESSEEKQKAIKNKASSEESSEEKREKRDVSSDSSESSEETHKQTPKVKREIFDSSSEESDETNDPLHVIENEETLVREKRETDDKKEHKKEGKKASEKTKTKKADEKTKVENANDDSSSSSSSSSDDDGKNKKDDDSSSSSSSSEEADKKHTAKKGKKEAEDDSSSSSSSEEENKKVDKKKSKKDDDSSSSSSSSSSDDDDDKKSKKKSNKVDDDSSSSSSSSSDDDDNKKNNKKSNKVEDDSSSSSSSSSDDDDNKKSNKKSNKVDDSSSSSSSSSSEDDDAKKTKNDDSSSSSSSSSSSDDSKVSKKKSNKDNDDSSSSSSSSSDDKEYKNNINIKININKDDSSSSSSSSDDDDEDKKKCNCDNDKHKGKNDESSSSSSSSDSSDDDKHKKNKNVDSSSSSSSSSSSDDSNNKVTKKSNTKKHNDDSSSSSSSSSSDDEPKKRKKRDLHDFYKPDSDEKHLVKKISNFAAASLNNEGHKNEVLEILKVKKIELEGAVYHISLRIGESHCSGFESCLIDEEKLCKFQIHITKDEKVIKVLKSHCHKIERFSDKNRTVNRSKRQLVGAPIDASDDGNIRTLTKETLLQLDSQSSHQKRFKVRKIITATKQIVSGIRYRITAELVYSDCNKNDAKDSDQCNEHDKPEPKVCKFDIWDQPWLPQGRKTSVSCGTEKHNFRSRRSIVSDKEEAIFKKFNEFIKSNKKYYGSDYMKRYWIFKENMQKVEMLNREELGTAKYGITKFADLDEKEFEKHYLGLRPELKNENEIAYKQAKIPDIELPESFDWREKGAVAEVKDQGQCGSCWAFSVTGNVEGQYFLKHGKLLEFSEQELVDCDNTDEGCNGGYMDNAYRAIEKLGGLELENDYPYDAKDEKCHFNKSLAVAKLSGAVNISHDESDMAKWLITNGPMSIGINANAMQFYMGGVSHPMKFLCSPSSLNHGVLIVGYGVHSKSNYPMFNKSLPYWIVKNSWGPKWGEQGYYRVFRGDGSCGVNQMVSSAVVE